VEEGDEKPRRRKKRRILRLIQWLFAFGILGFFAATIGIAAVFHHYTKNLPSTTQLANYDPAVVTRLYASDDKLMAEYAKEKRFFLPLSAIPASVQHAFISAEDQNFYRHAGVDFWGIARAMKENLSNMGSGRTMVGGSTITQQVVKNFLLTSEKSLERKVKEAVLAWRISQTYSKEKILELYLNQIYLGAGTYGVAAAAIHYFDKSLDELTSEEAALLAALPKAPAYFDPAKNYKRALERRNYVLGRMREDGFVDEAEYDRAVATPIITRIRSKDEVAHADFFAEEVRRALKQMYGDNVLYEGGLFVKTTLNTAFQDYADVALRHALMLYDQRHGYRGPFANIRGDLGGWQAALERVRQEKAIPLFDGQQLAVVLNVTPKAAAIGLMNGDRAAITLDYVTWARKKLSTSLLGPAIKGVNEVLVVGDVVLVEPVADSKIAYKLMQIPEVNGALVVMDPQTGKVLALSGGYSYGGSEFNRATQAKRQPGSAFKPFVYLTALENGFSPTSVVLDAPVELPQGPGLPMWKPKNYEGNFMGPTTFRTGLEKSRNLMTVRIAQMVGLKRIKRISKRLGIYEDDKLPENYSMVLGSFETTVLKLVNAYSMVANGGRRVSPWLIERIDDRNGTTIFRRDTRLCEKCPVDDAASSATLAPTLGDERERVIDPRVAYQLTSILKGAIQRGTGGAAKVLGRPLAGKTGTTNESRDTWFVGYTPDIVVGTYVGFDTPRPMGAKETGGRVPIQGFVKFMQQAGDAIPTKDFTPPPGIREIPIDRSSGQPLFAGADIEGASIIKEAFLTGGPIFKPANELEEELLSRDEQAPMLTPQEVGVPLETEGSLGDGTQLPGNGNNYTPPEAGEMAPYQRPVDPEGFNPNAGATTGTGGLY
jgi:penicillin-binding protein 1A